MTIGTHDDTWRSFDINEGGPVMLLWMGGYEVEVKVLFAINTLMCCSSVQRLDVLLMAVCPLYYSLQDLPLRSTTPTPLT